VDEAAGVMSVTYAGFLFGALLGPWGSDHLKSRKGPLAGGLICAGVVWGLLFFVPDVLTVGRIRFLLFLAGMAAGGQIVALSVMADLVPKSHVAMATAFANMIVMLAGSVLQYTAGCVLDLFWDGTLSSAGTRLYSCETFQKAVGAMVVWMGLGLLAVWRMKETHPLHEPSEGDSPA
jgi:MFS family permease